MDINACAAEAYSMGVYAAHIAAARATYGNTDVAHVRFVLALMEDCDPAADDYLPQRPNLSGEYAGDETPWSLARDIVGDFVGAYDEDVASDVIDALADAYETGVSDTFMDACETELRTLLDEPLDTGYTLTSDADGYWLREHRTGELCGPYDTRDAAIADR